ncbi:MAG TPA: hypothetical protein VM115_01140 [Vicinamibacterales bacterium]|nr:hypothetical protein [Vicinamibacterales bacterium]
MVAESVDAPRPSRMSTPPLIVERCGSSSCRSVLASVNGKISTRRGGRNRSPKDRWPNRDTNPLTPRGVPTHRIVSPVAGISRTIWSPHTVSSGGTSNRICENGIWNSAVHFSESTCVRTSHTAS